MGSVWRSGRASCVGAKLWFNGSDPVKPPWLTWPPCWRSPASHLQALGTTDLLSILITGENRSIPAVTVTRQDRHTPCGSICERQMTLRAVTHRWKPAQPGICHHRPRSPRSSWKEGVLRARKYTHGETAVLTFGGKEGGRRRGGIWQMCDACSCDGSADQRAAGCQWLITQTRAACRNPSPGPNPQLSPLLHVALWESALRYDTGL